MLSRLSARLAKIEQVLRPQGRTFIFAYYDGDELGLEERRGAFKIDHGVTAAVA